MKRFLEGLKDFLYDGVDYIMMIGVIVVVALIINWRLGGLFAKDELNVISKNPTEAIENTPSVSDGKEQDKPDNNSSKNTGGTDKNKDNLGDENSDALVKINIPPGSLPSKIGEILATNELVKDKDEFVKKAIDMKLETKLKYGEFEISKGSSMEEILQILTK